MNNAFANAWRLLKQIRLSPEERMLESHAYPRHEESDGLGARKTLLQSNLGLFDPDLELTTLNEDFKKVPVRIGRGKRKEETPMFERQYVKLSRNKDDPEGRYIYRLMGVPADGGPHVEMSSLGGYPHDNAYLRSKAPHHKVQSYLTSIGGETPKQFQRQGNYEKLLQAILASGMGIMSNNRNEMFSNPFHRKFSNKHRKLYLPKREYNDGDIETDERILYNRPEIRQNHETVIEQTPQVGVNPKGGFGSLARFDLNTLPIVEDNRQDFKTRNPDAKKTEQTLFAEGFSANANRGKPYPQSIHEFMRNPNRLSDNRRQKNDDMLSQVPHYQWDYTKYTPRELAIGQSAAFANHPTLTDLTTGEPVLIAQSGGNIQGGIEDYEYKQRLIRREEEEREKAERLQAMMMEMSQLIPNPQESLTHPDNSAFMQAFQTLRDNAQPQQYQNTLGDDDDFDGLGSILG